MASTVSPLAPFADEPPDAVTFDFWNTLVVADTARTRQARRVGVARVLAAHGVALDPEAVEGALSAAFDRFNAAWAANHQFTGEDGGAVLVEGLGLVGHPAAPELVGAFVRAGEGLPHELAPGVGGVVEALHGAGVRVGIVCDVGLTPSWILRGYLEAHDLLGWFDHWSFSDEVGVYKPDPVIFRHALDGLGVIEPGRSVHVGDLNRTDVAGARAFGMVAVRYAGVHDDAAVPLEGGPEADRHDAAPAAHAVVADHRDLLGLLGLR